MENNSYWIPIAVIFAHKDNFVEGSLGLAGLTTKWLSKRTYLTPNAYIYKDKSMKITPNITYTKPAIRYYDYKF